jgi:chemotaxis protein MotB
MADTPIIIKKKKSHGGHGHHGGSWKVAYADFVTAMMAFFMVMWIMGLSDETRAQIQGYFNDPMGFIKNQPKMKVNISPSGSPSSGKNQGKGNVNEAAGADEKSLGKLKSEITSAMEADVDMAKLLKHVEIAITDEGLRIELVESTVATFFESGRSTLLPSAIQFVSRIAPLVAETKRPIVIEGHTDAEPYPSDIYNNWDLSSDRANAMRRALQMNGVPAKQFAGIRALADTQLKMPDKPLNVANRRVTLLLPFKKPQDSKVYLPRDEFEQRLKSPAIPPVEIVH